MLQTEGRLLPSFWRCTFCKANVGFLNGCINLHEAPVCDEFKKIMADQEMSAVGTITVAGLADYPA